MKWASILAGVLGSQRQCLRDTVFVFDFCLDDFLKKKREGWNKYRKTVLSHLDITSQKYFWDALKSDVKRLFFYY